MKKKIKHSFDGFFCKRCGENISHLFNKAEEKREFSDFCLAEMKNYNLENFLNEFCPCLSDEELVVKKIVQ